MKLFCVPVSDGSEDWMKFTKCWYRQFPSYNKNCPLTSIIIFWHPLTVFFSSTVPLFTLIKKTTTWTVKASYVYFQSKFGPCMWKRICGICLCLLSDHITLSTFEILWCCSTLSIKYVLPLIWSSWTSIQCLQWSPKSHLQDCLCKIHVLRRNPC